MAMNLLVFWLLPRSSNSRYFFFFGAFGKLHFLLLVSSFGVPVVLCSLETYYILGLLIGMLWLRLAQLIK